MTRTGQRLLRCGCWLLIVVLAIGAVGGTIRILQGSVTFWHVWDALGFIWIPVWWDWARSVGR